MKDVASCDKPRVGANIRLSGDFRMGKPGPANTGSSVSEYIGHGDYTGGTETSKYPEEEKVKTIPSVVASERGRAQIF